MGFLALLPDGSTIAPAVDVLQGLLSPGAANTRYRQVTGSCPHCQQLRDSQAGTDNARIQQALSIADLSIHYVSASIQRGVMTRIMHFAHRRGFLQGPDACLLCRNADLAHHAAAVQVIGRWAQKQWPAATVNAEMRITVPGTPPSQFQPDITIATDDGTPIACIEYQRSHERFDDFVRRDALRRTQFDTVIWFLCAGTYGRSAQHRDYLHTLNRTFYRCWVERETGQLQYEEGRPPSNTPRAAKEPTLDGCSESSLIRVLEAPPTTAPAAPRIDPQLEMVNAGAIPARVRPMASVAHPAAAPEPPSEYELGAKVDCRQAPHVPCVGGLHPPARSDHSSIGWTITDLVHTSKGWRYRIERGGDFRIVSPEVICRSISDGEVIDGI